MCREVPKQWRPLFDVESEDAKDRMMKLKSRIATSGLEVFDG